MARLNLQAPFTGVWRDIAPDWQPGQWVGRREPLGVLIDPSRWQVDAYVKPDEIHRLQPGSQVHFYPDGQPVALPGRVIAIGTTRISHLEHPMLASRHGGPLATANEGEELIPNPPVFHVLIQLDQPPESLHETRGRLQIDGARRSLLAEGLTRLAAVALRESGF
ncbi:hypothetical protein D3C76_1077800 [compost metagenome]